jgi:glycine/D-amino acid oxidase-like deaminating enzyme
LTAAAAYRQLSLWHDTAGEDWTSRPALPGDLDCDVAIVGGGYTGLWTAFYLRRSRPGLRVVVVEAEVAGFGASGRNGGWCSALFPRSTAALAAAHGLASALAMQRAMRDSIDEIARVVTAEDIDCGFAKGGTVSAARTTQQLTRARAEVEAARAHGSNEGDLALLTADQAATRIRTTRQLGALYTPHCAAIHPARLVRGLARAVERAGAVIYEQTAATTIEPRRVVTPRGTIRADVVVRATEGFTPRLPGEHRAVVPVYSLMVATEPLPAEMWEAIGLARRETFNDLRHLIIYGQRTADDRLAFGGRGAPYHFASSVRARFDRSPRVFRALRRTLTDMFPVLAATRFTHQWGGPLAIARDWNPSVGYDRRSGMAWAGGYVGDGVSTTNLAGRTLADLIGGIDSGLTRLPWVDHRSRSWEPEPLRWLGINAGLAAMTLADHEERITHRESVLARLMSPLLGGH